MGYYIRVLGKNVEPVALDLLQSAAAPALLEIDEGNVGVWKQLTLKHESGVEIALIERNPVVEGELGADELQEFQDEVGECKPDSGAAWLASYLPTVKVIYALQLLGGTDIDDGWSALHRVHAALWNAAGGILQADGEGFSNEAGYTILWQFSEGVSGEWNAGVLNASGDWTHFQMDLGDVEQRRWFVNGQVPAGAKLL